MKLQNMVKFSTIWVRKLLGIQIIYLQHIYECTVHVRNEGISIKLNGVSSNK